MAIVDMTKFRLLTFSNNRHNLLDEFQKFDAVQFNRIENVDGFEEVKNSAALSEVQADINDVNRAMEMIRPFVTQVGIYKSMVLGKEDLSFEELEKKGKKFDYKSIYKEMNDKSEQREVLKVYIQKLKDKIKELSHWTNIEHSFNSIRKLKNPSVVTGMIRRINMSAIVKEFETQENIYGEIVNFDSAVAYIMVIYLEEDKEKAWEILRNYGFVEFKYESDNTPAEEIDKAVYEIRRKEAEAEILRQEIGDFAKYQKDFQIQYEYLMNKKLRILAEKQVVNSETVDVWEGYIPKKLNDEFKSAIDKTSNGLYYIEMNDAEKDDEDVPIMLKNNEFASKFESITTMYAMPKYNEIDPTPYLSIFYWLFFGMMVADIGYGVIVLLISLFALKKFHLSPSQKETAKLGIYLSFSIILWGVIYGSCLGGAIPVSFGLIDMNKDINTMMALSLVFGGIHLFFGLGLKAYMCMRDQKYEDAIVGVYSWYMVLSGGIMLLLGTLLPIDKYILLLAKGSMILGSLIIILFSGRSSKKLSTRLILGVYDLYGISSYIGDFVSYVRLMALGLSGGFIAAAVNMIANMLSESKSPVGIVSAVLVFVFFQAFNIFLSMLSAYVHTSRLTYVEFFGKFYEGGGKPFVKLKHNPTYINYKN